MRKMLYLLTLSLTICLGTSIIDTKAISSSSLAIISPNVVCDPDFGCYYSYSMLRKIISTPIYYNQHDYTDPMYGGCICMDGSENPCSISSAGCALTSFSMILANYKNNTSNYTPNLVNTGLYNGGVYPTYNSCNFVASNWGNKSIYKTSVTYYDTDITPSGIFYTSETIYPVIKSSIDNNRYIIFKGGPKTTNGTDYHYSLIIGYEKIDIDYVSQPDVHTVKVFISDPGNENRIEITQFISVYHNVTNFYAFRKD